MAFFATLYGMPFPKDKDIVSVLNRGDSANEEKLCTHCGAVVGLEEKVCKICGKALNYIEENGANKTDE